MASRAKPHRGAVELRAFADDLRALVRCTGRTESAVAAKLKISRSSFSDYMCGSRLAKLETVQAIVRECDGNVRIWSTRWRLLRKELDEAVNKGGRPHQKARTGDPLTEGLGQLLHQALAAYRGHDLAGATVKIILEITLPEGRPTTIKPGS